MNTPEINLPENKEPTELELAAVALFKRIPFMVSDYRALIRHSGGLMTKSMGIAYQRGLNDALKQLIKEIKNGHHS